MNRNFQTLAFFAAVSAAGCSAPKDDSECDGTLTLNITSVVPDTVSGPLVVQGTVTTDRNIAVRSVNVAGVEAELSSFNFRTWTATVPFETLLALKPLGKSSDDVAVSIEAVPVCGTSDSETVNVKLDRPPKIAVGSLAVTPAFSGEHTYLPADGSVSALLTVTGSPEARGATVSLRATGQGHFSGSAETLSVVLAGDGKLNSMTTALVTAQGAGSVFVTASAAGVFANPVKIDSAEAPKLFPPTANLLPGQSLIVLVQKQLSQQKVVNCTIEQAKGLSVKAASDWSSFTLVAADTLTEAVEASIDCYDDYRQATSVTYTAAPAPKD